MEAIQQYFQKVLVEEEWKSMYGHLQAVDVETVKGEVRIFIVIVLQASVVLSRGKKRIGYELEFKVRFEGIDKWDGVECAIELKEFCDDGSQESKLFVTKEPKSSNGGIKFKQEAERCKLVDHLVRECREFMNAIRDEA